MKQIMPAAAIMLMVATSTYAASLTFSGVYITRGAFREFELR
jgi:hypothetical protein